MGSKLGVLKIAAKRCGLTLEEYQAKIEAGEKRCSGCKQWKKAYLFGKDRTRGSRLGAKCLSCRCTNTSDKPGQQERRHMAVLGMKWCRDCKDWLPAQSVTKSGLCRTHENAQFRHLYATGVLHNTYERKHARARNIDPMPEEACTLLTEMFDGLCAYCAKRPATTWDHIHPVALGGTTVPGNILPACKPCNSSKKDLELDDWIVKTQPPLHPMIEAILGLDVWSEI